MSGKILNYDDLVNLGNIETSDNPFVAKIRSVRGQEKNLIASQIPDEETRAEALGPIRARTWAIENMGLLKGFGYIASSLRNDSEREACVASLIASAFSNSGTNITPLVLGIEDFYSYKPHHPTLAGKADLTNDEEYRRHGRPQHAIIVSDFSSSDIFSSDVLAHVPSQDALGLRDKGTITEDPEKDTRLRKFGERLSFFSYGALPSILEREGSISEAFVALSQAATTTSTEDVKNLKILMATSLLYGNGQTWQNLVESSKERVPLYIVAPHSFHSAMNRVNISRGHGLMDYTHRAASSLGCSSAPPFEIENGRVVLEEELERNLARVKNQGMQPDEVLRRLEPMLARLEASRPSVTRKFDLTEKHEH